MRRSIQTLLLVLLIAPVIGCGILSGERKVVYVHPNDPVQLAQDVPGVSVWVYDDNGEKVHGHTTLPEGFWVVYLSPEDEEAAVREKEEGR